MFTITMHRGVHFTFPAVTVSVQWGPSNYCDNRGDDYRAAKQSDMWISKTAEVAVWSNNADQTWVKGWPHASENDDVAGYLTLQQVMDILKWAEAQPVVTDDAPAT